MTIHEERPSRSQLLVILSGRLDTVNSPFFERKMKQWGSEILEVTLDFADVSFVSSMGLRVLLQIQKAMKERNGKLIVRNINDAVKEVFEMTGFIKLFVKEEKLVIIRKDEAAEGITLSLAGQINGSTVSILENELRQLEGENTGISLDFEKVTLLSTGAARAIRVLLKEPVWEKRKVVIRSAGGDVLEKLRREGVEALSGEGAMTEKDLPPP
ncbi:MAG: STAS domain-containing protein [Spirochaetales bacterium]|jgi:anti-sigma B factor antagonist|nr:STAS domain-containing protein [Spirochaetales bacterium]